MDLSQQLDDNDHLFCILQTPGWPSGGPLTKDRNVVEIIQNYHKFDLLGVWIRKVVYQEKINVP